jgi:hypothetical protein
VRRDQPAVDVLAGVKHMTALHHQIIRHNTPPSL